MPKTSPFSSISWALGTSHSFKVAPITGLILPVLRASRASIASAPLGMLITAVLLANNIRRDIETDSRSGIKTLATTLGLKRSTIVYLTLLLGSIAYTLALVALRVLPVTSAITVLVLPLAIKLTRISLSGRIPADFDPMTARVVLLYSMLLIASLLVAVLLK